MKNNTFHLHKGLGLMHNEEINKRFNGASVTLHVVMSGSMQWAKEGGATDKCQSGQELTPPEKQPELLQSHKLL